MSRKDGQEKPQRSCVGCRETRDRNGLIRFVLSPHGEVVPDLEARLPGRGAYTCISAGCVETAIRQRLFNRAFKREVVTPQAEAMAQLVRSLMRDRVLGYLGLANRAGKIVSGSSLVCEAMRSKNKPALILVAHDASSAIADKVLALAAANCVRAERVLTKDVFGSILGKSPRSAVAVRQSGFVERLISEITRYRNFLGEVQGICQKFE